MIINYGKVLIRNITYSSPPFLGHALAGVGVILLHGGLAAWAMTPDKPVPLPQQQVIQVSMVAPSIITQKPTPEPVVKKEIVTPKLAPKKKGMVKVKPKPKKQPLKEVKKQPPRKPEPKVALARPKQTLMTSGTVSQNAEQTRSAFTKPRTASYLNNPPPQYPRQARRRNQQGTVMVDVRVSRNGLPTKLSISQSSGFSSLDEAALQAVRQWKFVPAKRGSHTIEASLRVPVTFRLKRGS